MSDAATGALRTDMPLGFSALHADAERLLTRWSAPTDALAATRDRMLDVLARDETAMWRGHSPVHFTASLVVLGPNLDEVALTLHGKAKRWFQFGGHFEATDTSLVGAAAREGREESGLAAFDVLADLVQVDAHTLSSAFGWCREHLDLRFAAVASDRGLSVSDESDDVRWFALDALPHDTEPSLRQAIELAREAAVSRDVELRHAAE